MLFDKKVKPGGYVIEKEGANTLLKINYDGYPSIPSIEDSDATMAKVMDILVESPGVNTILFTQRRNYVYSYEQTNILNEIAGLYSYLTKQKKILSLSFFEQTEAFQFYSQEWRETLNFLIYNLLKSDPIGAYVELKRILRDEKIKIRKTESLDDVHARSAYVETLNYLIKLLDGATLISLVRNSLAGHVVGSRGIYRTVFKPEIGPDFVFTRLMAEIPLYAEEIDAYNLDAGTDVTIYKIPNDIKYYYHLSPPEFKISEEKYVLLDLARNSMLEYKPKKEEFTDPEKMRRTFFNIGKDMLTELAEHRGYDLSYAEIDELAHILVRYTVGFGFVELLLKDKNIQDINVNGPIGETPLFIVHGDYDECTTNIIPAREDGESWATKFRIISGRPLDEANPVLDTELILPYARARVAVMGKPLNPSGLAFAFRRHRDNPWTYPLFISNRMMGPYAAGLLSFLVDGGRAVLFAGTRGSGKTSLLGSTLVELMRKHRIIVVEDTQEIPNDYLRKIGYNIQAMKVRSALTKGGSEVGADEGIRTSLRFGDSSLIIGEIRSTESKALYEAMRIGALANLVAGTIHGASPYAVYDRVVNDLEVPKTSFKATDIIVISNPVKTSGGLHKQRRILQITEVRKHWENDPLRENGFVDLMKYDVKDDLLKPTEALLQGDSDVLKSIASQIKEFTGNWDAVLDNIQLRANIKRALVEMANKTNNYQLLEADFVVKSNDSFHQLMDDVREKTGSLDSKRIFFEWGNWLKKEVKNFKT
ncbi:type II/IV secretion system ATPase subunit [Candidatus Woesearchaeota archaeon]|nr:type II/IV secretion system ATPase subunit [Candidatus Woesearchaeota archaeon]